MPRSLFDQTLVPSPARRRPVGTIAFSVMMHGVALGAIVAWQLTATTDGPSIGGVLRAWAAPPPPGEPIVPAPPPVRAVPPSPAITPNQAPVAAAESITPEPAALPSPARPGLHDGLNTSLTVDPRAMLRIGTPVGITPSAPPIPTAVRLGGEIREPRRVFYVAPAYPVAAQAARVEGVVILEATIDETGVVRDVTVLRSRPLLDQAAIEAVSRWRYTPTYLNGLPVSVVMSVTVNFTMR
jgi:periplasmic protein TonB